jgi:outer membrane protein OmpA-like peptidoglycan-associated protein
VKSYLAGKGIAAGRLEAKGFGPDRPITAEKTPAGRAKNRRVEFVVKSP